MNRAVIVIRDSLLTDLIMQRDAPSPSLGQRTLPFPSGLCQLGRCDTRR